MGTPKECPFHAMTITWTTFYKIGPQTNRGDNPNYVLMSYMYIMNPVFIMWVCLTALFSEINGYKLQYLHTPAVVTGNWNDTLAAGRFDCTCVLSTFDEITLVIYPVDNSHIRISQLACGQSATCKLAKHSWPKPLHYSEINPGQPPVPYCFNSSRNISST